MYAVAAIRGWVWWPRGLYRTPYLVVLLIYIFLSRVVNACSTPFARQARIARIAYYISIHPTQCFILQPESSRWGKIHESQIAQSNDRVRLTLQLLMVWWRPTDRSNTR
ncbi:hypothetical protein F4678DRAFT_382819 [Xylaria arbuscula]|nr:hypothetical protein F4678DRAFT_382819 [Xylaria arbuscula]